MRTVAILGKARSVSAVAAGAERWGINDLPVHRDEGWAFDAWDRWFDRHTRAHILKHRPEAWAWYRAQDGRRPIYLLEPEAAAEVPGGVVYPTETVQDWFAWGGQPEEFFTSSVDWMIALALLEGVARIELQGVDFWAASHERGVQRTGAHYWIGRARGLGCDIVIPAASSLCKIERTYGDFRLTSARNFSSVSVDRFLAQWREAERLRDPAYVPPGVDTPPVQTSARVAEKEVRA
ncbi:MAG: hypothetical protein A3J29_06175 [Acidobacteria bacterium RIFCSPLOWO2_12_FULL_67_14b]|nr:MAG: hypothetical protein A3J29_06175 [Acidobacteria bacterium RIFCSPLOWO2_12_FULL_67_14b]